MTFADAVRTCLRKYATFSGRASRSEYWWFFLFVVGGGAVIATVHGILFGPTETEVAPGLVKTSYDGGLPGTLFSLATFLPTLAAGWRRMHDTGRPGLYLLYPLIVMAGIGGAAAVLGDSGLGMIVIAPALIVLLISPLLVLWWLARPSEPGQNDYGPNPHEVTP